MKLLLDEMWTQRIAVQLRGRGHEVIAVSEQPDLRSRSDAVIFAFAQTEGYAVVTENVADFSRLAAYELNRADRTLALSSPAIAGFLATILALLGI